MPERSALASHGLVIADYGATGVVFDGGPISLPAEDLAIQLQSFVTTVGDVVGKIPAEISGFHLDTVEIAVEISAKDTISLLGTGGEVAGKGGLTFTLKR